MRPSCVDQWPHLKQRGTVNIYPGLPRTGLINEKKRARLSTLLCPRGIITSLFLILCPRTCNPLSVLSYVIYGSLLLSVTDYHTVEACNTTSCVFSKKEHYEEDKSQQGPTVISSDEHFSRAKCSRETPASSSPLFPGTLENYAHSLWTDYRQLKVWQHLKLSPHVANDSPSTDITFNASAAVISIRRTGRDKRTPEE